MGMCTVPFPACSWDYCCVTLVTVGGHLLETASQSATRLPSKVQGLVMGTDAL